MAHRRKRRHARYDRLFGAGMLLLCIIFLIIGLTKCTHRKKEETVPKHNGAEDVIISSEVADAEEQKNYPEKRKRPGQEG